MPILKLPFVFDVEVLPSSRHRNVERAKLRDYTHVMVEELRSVDMELAIVATDGNGDASDPFRGEPYHLHGDHLYRRARHRATGETFDAASFEEAVSPVYDLRTTWPYTEGGDGIPFERSSYPGPHCRWNGDRWKPLWFWEEEKRAAADGWKPTRRFISSSRATAIGIAHEFLSKAVVLVEGEIFVACTEPVWAFDPYEDQRERLRLDRSPTTRMAMGKFSLDRLAAAKEWCRRRGGDPTPHGSADVLVPNALGRDDDWELANCVLDRLRHVPRAYPGSDPDVWEAARSLSDQWDVRDGRIPRDRAGELLEAVHGVVLSLDTLGKGRYDWVEKDLMLIAERWAAVREDWLHQQLDEDDLAALCERFD